MLRRGVTRTASNSRRNELAVLDLNQMFDTDVFLIGSTTRTNGEAKNIGLEFRTAHPNFITGYATLIAYASPMHLLCFQSR